MVEQIYEETERKMNMRTWNKEKIIEYLDNLELKRDILEVRIVSASDRDKFYLGYLCGDYYDATFLDIPNKDLGTLMDLSFSKSISSITLHSLCDGCSEGDEVLIKTVERKDGSTNIDSEVIEAFSRLLERILEFRTKNKHHTFWE